MIAKRVAAALNLLDSLWVLYLVLTYLNASYSCPAGGCPAVQNFWVFDTLLAVGTLLLIDAGVGFTGRWLAFPLGAVLSLTTIPLLALQWGAFGTTYAAIAVALATAALILDAVAAISRTKLSEQSHPLNLPVFG